MFIKRLAAIMIIGGWGLTLASGSEPVVCYNLIQADPTTPGGYQIVYADGSVQSFGAGNTINITNSGSYKLCGDVVGLSEPIGLSASSIELDLGGFSVIGTDGNDGLVGITNYSTISDIVIKNGRVINYQAGVWLGSNVTNAFVQDVYAINCGASSESGCENTFCAGFITAISTDIVFDRCIAAGGANPGAGFVLTGNDIVVKDCLALNNAQQGFQITDFLNENDSMNVLIERSVAIGNSGHGFENDKPTGVLLGNLAYGNGTNYAAVAPGVVGSIVIDNGAQLPPGAAVNRSIDNIEII